MTDGSSPNPTTEEAGRSDDPTDRPADRPPDTAPEGTPAPEAAPASQTNGQPSSRDGVYRLINVVFDRLEVFWEGDRARRVTANLLILVFLGTLLVIEAKRQGFLPPEVSGLVPTSHFGAVSMAFTFFLILEIIGLVFALSRSVANAVGKQFEIFSLILLREAFKEFSNFGEPIQWMEVRQPVYHMLADAVGALLIFVVIAFYYRAQKHRQITADPEDQVSFVTAKKLISLALLVTFAGIGIHDLTLLLSGGTPYPFFKTFYTILVFSDVLIVLLSLRYTATYHVVFRNSGFALGTVALRIALAAPPYVNAAIGFGAALFVLGLTYAYNAFGTFLNDRAAREAEATTSPETSS
jgi:hypothetical protein